MKMQNPCFLFNGTKLVRCVPENNRNKAQCTVETFKRKLDDWLSSVSDEPPTKDRSGGTRTE